MSSIPALVQELLKIFVGGGGGLKVPHRWNRVKVQITVYTSTFYSFSGLGYVNSKTLKV